MELRSLATGVEITKQDISNKLKKQYEEIEPYAVEPNTGVVLNPTNRYILKETEPINIPEYVNSFKEDSDIATIIKNYVACGCNKEYLKQRQVGFFDLFNIKNNVGELNTEENRKILQEFEQKQKLEKTKQDVKMVTISEDELNALKQNQIKKELIKEAK